MCRLIHTSFSSAKLAAISMEKTKLQTFVSSLVSSGKFTCSSDLIELDDSSSFLDFRSYFQHFSSVVQSSSIGQTILIADQIPTTMKFLDGCTLTSDETVVIARQQSEGQGRGTNQWTSPLGCALFTIYFDVNLQSLLGQRLSLLQLVASVAVVQAIEKTADYKALNVRIKWPNDVFIGHDFAKLGGILATSSISGNSASIKLGIGVNVSNSEPSVCLNDAIDQQKSTKTLTHFTMEEFLGRTIGYFHQWISKLSQPNILQATISVYNFYQIYQSLWMHQNQEVFVEKWKEKVTIVGIDEYGFLKVRKSSTGDVLTLHADVHSFDVRNGVIYEKPI